MHVNCPSAFISNHPNEKDDANEVGDANSAAASSCIGSTTLSRANLRGRVTPRTEDYLQRLRVHGNPTQRSLAISTCDALERNRFIASPSRDKPVVQFGVSMTSDEKKGVLLANFMPHDDKLELEALAFRAERFFETEAGGIEKVILRHAQELPEVGAAEHLIGSAAPAKLPELKQRSQGDIAYEKKALKKDVKRFDKQTMHRKMASKLADMRVNDGRSSSRMTALPIAHVTVASARLRQLATAPFQHMLGKSDALKAKLPSIQIDAPIPSALGILRGLQYEFSKSEFSKFYEEHWLPADDAKRTAAPEKNRPPSLEEAMHTQDADATPRPERMNRQLLMGNNIRTELQIRLDQSLSSSSEQVEATPDADFAPPQDRRNGQLMGENMKIELQKLLDDAEVVQGSSGLAAEQPKSPQSNYSPEQSSLYLEAQRSRMQLTQALVRENIYTGPVVIKMPKLNSASKGEGRLEYSQSEGGVQQGDIIKSGKYLILGDIKFSCEKDESRMLEIAKFINKLPVSNILQQAGTLSIRFGKTTGRTPGEWDGGKRVIVLDPKHPNIRENRNGDIIGTAVFEILNAASDNSRLASEQRARNGEFERMAETTGFPAPKLYARELEHQEFVNAMQHHNLMVQSGHGNTSKDLFSGETNDFEVFFNRQVASGHSHSYEQHYNFLCPSQPDLTAEYNSWKSMIERRKNDTEPNGEGGSSKDYFGNNL